MERAQWMVAEAGTGLGMRPEFSLRIAYDEFARRSERRFLCNLIDWPAKEDAFCVDITWRHEGRVNSQSRQAERAA
jgi:hypothetical protein